MPLRAFLLFGLYEQEVLRVFLLDSFNALAGIFAFWTIALGAVSPLAQRAFQCPCGHFCFLDEGQGEQYTIFFWCFNALAGIFAFWTL